MITLISKEQFLIEHNRLSPANLQTTFALLTQFQEEKKPLLRDTNWSLKLRLPFIIWLGNTLPKQLKTLNKEPIDQIYKNYPETKW